MKQSAGQTLLEVMVAIAIIVVGILSLISLIISTHTTARLSFQEAVAIQLGRETIEAAHFVRDTNWLERDAGTDAAYDDGLHSSTDPTDYTAIYTWQDTQTDPSAAITFDFTPNSLSDTATTVYTQTSTHYYSQTTGTVPASWTATPFRRFVSFYPICSNDAGVDEYVLTTDGQSCTTSYPDTIAIGVEVAVAVQWTDQGNIHSRTIAERQYNWKYTQESADVYTYEP